jgi:hypothetical protein
MVIPFVKSWHKFPSVLGGHITKHNKSSAERRHFPFGGQALCFQDACVKILKLFYCDVLATRRISTGYKHFIFTVIPIGYPPGITVKISAAIITPGKALGQGHSKITSPQPLGWGDNYFGNAPVRGLYPPQINPMLPTSWLHGQVKNFVARRNRSSGQVGFRDN